MSISVCKGSVVHVLARVGLSAAGESEQASAVEREASLSPNDGPRSGRSAYLFIIRRENGRRGERERK